MVEPRRLEGAAEVGVDSLVGSEHDADDERLPLTRRPEGERVGNRRAQPVADATDPAPPADDVPGSAGVQDHVDPTPLEPCSLVESGLGPSRGDRARSELEHGALRRRAPGRQLEQHPFAQLDAVESTHLGHRSDGERRASRRPRDDDLRRRGIADPQREVAVVELLHPEPAPPEAGRRESDAGQAESQRRRQPE